MLSNLRLLDFRTKADGQKTIQFQTLDSCRIATSRKPFGMFRIRHCEMSAIVLLVVNDQPTPISLRRYLRAGR